MESTLTAAIEDVGDALIVLNSLIAQTIEDQTAGEVTKWLIFSRENARSLIKTMEFAKDEIKKALPHAGI